MKKLIISIVFALFAIMASSTEANAQVFQVNNNTAVSVQVDYCSMSTGTLSPGTFSTTSTCTISLPCSVDLSFPGTACGVVTIPLSPCPSLGSDYVLQTSITTGCTALPKVNFTFYYDGVTNDIIITLN